MFKHLDWDSQFFNYKVALLDSEKIQSEADVNVCLKELKKMQYRLAYIFIPSQNSKLNEIVKQQGGILVDAKTTYATSSIRGEEVSTNIISFLDNKPGKDLLDLAIESGIYSRFSKDKNFKNNEFGRLYTEWITNSVNRKIADEVLVYNENNKISGFVTLKADGSNGKIGLIAVSAALRGKGIGRELMKASHNWYLSKKLTTATVITQGENKPACKLYEKCGYHISEVQNVYHFWL